MAQILNKNFKEVVQLILDKNIGEGKAEACDNGAVKFLFPETHFGCNEMQCGTWTVGKTVRVYIYIDYVEAFEHLKCGSKPVSERVVSLSDILPRT